MTFDHLTDIISTFKCAAQIGELIHKKAFLSLKVFQNVRAGEKGLWSGLSGDTLAIGWLQGVGQVPRRPCCPTESSGARVSALGQGSPGRSSEGNAGPPWPGGSPQTSFLLLRPHLSARKNEI